jgi:hypothetical protein
VWGARGVARVQKVVNKTDVLVEALNVFIEASELAKTYIMIPTNQIIMASTDEYTEYGCKVRSAAITLANGVTMTALIRECGQRKWAQLDVLPITVNCSTE